MGHQGEAIPVCLQKFTFNVMVKIYSVACNGNFRWYVLLFSFTHSSQITEPLSSVQDTKWKQSPAHCVQCLRMEREYALGSPLEGLVYKLCF